MEYFCFRWNSNSTNPCLIAACSRLLKNVKHKKGKEEDIPVQNCSIFIVQFQFNLKQPCLLFNHFLSLVFVPSPSPSLPPWEGSHIPLSPFSIFSSPPTLSVLTSFLFPGSISSLGAFGILKLICPLVLPSSFSPLIIQRLNPPIPPTSLWSSWRLTQTLLRRRQMDCNKWTEGPSYSRGSMLEMYLHLKITSNLLYLYL